MRRSGASLIEVVIAMTASSGLMLLAIGILHQSMSLSSQSKTRNEFLHSNARLARQFREDVHAATSCITEQSGALVMQLTGAKTVSYQASREDRSVSRQLIDAQTQTRQPDRFQLLGNAQCRFRIDESPGRVLLEITTSIPGETELIRMEMRVSATINRQRQLTTVIGGNP